MTIAELMEKAGAAALTKDVALTREIGSGYCCDLLSWVMAHGKPGMAWITVQTHMNVIAVATLHEMSCVVIPENGRIAPDVQAKAEEEGIAVLSSPLTAFELSGVLYESGVRA